MRGGQRHTEPVDVHLILRRESAAGPQVLLSRRAGQVYAAGLWHLVSGHLDGPHEDVVTALVREAREESGVVIDPADVRAAVTVHHRSPGGSSRTGHFFEVRRWQGRPRICEPDVCDAMDWAPLDALPDGMVAYCRAGLDAYRAGARLAVHFQLPGDAIAHDPDADRLRLVPDASRPAHVSRQIHQNDKFHGREVRALRTWARSLGGAAPRLVATDAELRAVVVTALPGRHLRAARPHLAPGDEEFVRYLVRQDGVPAQLEWVETHGAFRLRNILHDDGEDTDGSVAVIDLERSEPSPAVRDLVRLSDAWADRPDLHAAFMAGYGRPLTSAEEDRLVIDMALDAVRGISFGVVHGDPELAERGHRTLARLRAERRNSSVKERS